jgi:hypothetical protein
MMNLRLRAGIFLLVSIAVACVLPSCGGDSSKPETPTTDPTAAAVKVNQANALMGAILYEQMNGSPDQPSDIDLRPAEALYQSALALDPANLDAHFGVAVTGMLTMTSDAEVNGAFDEWSSYLESNSPFEIEHTRSRSPMGVPISFSRGSEALELPFQALPLGMLAQARTSLKTGDPQISRIQAIIADRALPRLTTAIAHLTTLGANPSYTFTVTPDMQGDHDADPLTIDQTDILALKAACSLLASLCHMAVSYDVGFASYDSLGMYNALRSGGTWLKLNSGGAAHMGAALTSAYASLDALDAAITALLAETGDQSHDVIKIGPDGLSRDDVESVQDEIPNVRNALQQGFSITEDWDNNESTPPVALLIHPGALFTNPVPDWKALLPGYTLKIGRRPSGNLPTTPMSADTVQASVTVPDAGYFNDYYYYDVEERTHVQEGGGSTGPLGDALRGAVLQKFHEMESDPDWWNFYGHASWYGPLNAGANNIDIIVWTSWSVVNSWSWVPGLEWTAETFEQWQFPDASMHGLLPGITTTNQLETLFGITADDWQREVVWSKK